MARRLRLFFGLTGVMAVLAAFALPSNAGLLSHRQRELLRPELVPGVPALRRRLNYMLTPGGSFEDGTPDWALNGGARVTTGNESYFLHARGDDESLYMPSGSSATSPTMCFAAGDWHLRFVGKGSGRVHVTVQVNSLLGLVSILDGGTVSPNGSWRRRRGSACCSANVGGLLTTKAISLKLSASNGSVQIDDVYLDPWKDTSSLTLAVSRVNPWFPRGPLLRAERAFRSRLRAVRSLRVASRR